MHGRDLGRTSAVTRMLLSGGIRRPGTMAPVLQIGRPQGAPHPSELDWHPLVRAAAVTEVASAHVDLRGRDTRPEEDERLVPKALRGLGELVVDVAERQCACGRELVVVDPARDSLEVDGLAGVRIDG